MDLWFSINGNSLKSLKQDQRYPDTPDTKKTIDNMASPLNMGDNYGLRLRSYFVVSFYCTVLRVAIDSTCSMRVVL